MIATSRIQRRYDHWMGAENISIPSSTFFLGESLAWKVSDTFHPAVTASLLRESLEGSTSVTPTLMVDGGIENYNTSVDTIVDECLLKRVLAQTEISFSNSMIESFWKAMKHQWLYLNTLGSVTHVQNLVSFYVSEHNTKLPHSAFKGQTPDEMYFGTGAEIPDQLTASRIAARQKRLELVCCAVEVHHGNGSLGIRRGHSLGD